MKLKLGDKVRGFRYDESRGYVKAMDKFIGQIGTVEKLEKGILGLRFESQPFTWVYPLKHPQAKRINSFKNKLK